MTRLDLKNKIIYSKYIVMKKKPDKDSKPTDYYKCIKVPLKYITNLNL